jgi:alpha-galactosidase
MIRKKNECYILETKDTTYCFRQLPTGHLEQLYYGRRIDLSESIGPIIEKRRFLEGNLIAYSKENPQYALENLCLEISSMGKGDIREPFMQILHHDGGSTSNFLFQSDCIQSIKKPLATLPSAYDDSEEAQSLEISLYDKNYDLTLVLTYAVFYNSNVITKSAKLINHSQNEVRIDRLMSGQLDLDTNEYVITTFHGAWAREMKRCDLPCQPGIYINDSKTGTSSNRSNPFFFLSKEGTTEEYGECYGFNLIYSGNHYGAVEVNSMGKVRVLQGIQPFGFSYYLASNESFETPEAVMTYSHKGYTGMSHNMHHFVQHHIVRGEWKWRERPVLVNSWEANYFKFNENKLVKLAKAAKDVGVELFVLDDGWFGKREDDTSSLGDWYENKKKLPGGLKQLGDKIVQLGLSFGIWVEPEMVNEDSDLYRKHPDWAVKIPGMEHSTGRNQMLLDLTREEVRTYLIDEMTRVFASAPITYVKWDMNRIFSDHFSIGLDAKRQVEFDYRYMVGLYQMLEELTKRFPHILFESCASGGNRFDLGMLCYMPQIWASDNTDAMSRAHIQTGYSYGYPMSVLGAHVSGCPNHQTLRNTSIDTRFEVAAFGLLGYECNLTELNEEEYQAVKDQIAFYKKYRSTLQYGDFYRIQYKDGITKWMTVDKDKKRALGLYLQQEVIPNFTYGKFVTKGLEDKKRYHFTNRQRIFNIKEFGDLINTVSPIHIKKDSIVHGIIAKLKKMPGEVEDCFALGEVFNYAGVKLKQGFGGVGYDEEIRLFQDYSSRMYVWEEDVR